MKAREKPSQYAALLMTLYGKPGAEEAMERYRKDYEAWSKKWAALEAKGYLS